MPHAVPSILPELNKRRRLGSGGPRADCASGRTKLIRRGRRLAGTSIEICGQPPQLIRRAKIGRIVRGTAAVLGLALKILLCGQGTPSRAFFYFQSGARR